MAAGCRLAISAPSGWGYASLAVLVDPRREATRQRAADGAVRAAARVRTRDRALAAGAAGLLVAGAGVRAAGDSYSLTRASTARGAGGTIAPGTSSDSPAAITVAAARRRRRDRAEQLALSRSDHLRDALGRRSDPRLVGVRSLGFPVEPAGRSRMPYRVPAGANLCIICRAAFTPLSGCGDVVRSAPALPDAGAGPHPAGGARDSHRDPLRSIGTLPAGTERGPPGGPKLQRGPRIDPGGATPRRPRRPVRSDRRTGGTGVSIAR
jgi:hypothetical protein